MKAIIAKLKRAHAQALQQAHQIEQAIHALNGAKSGTKTGRTRPGRKRRTMSAAGRRRISLAQKKRWAKLRKKS